MDEAGAAARRDGAAVLAQVLVDHGARRVFAILGDSNHRLGHALEAVGCTVVVGRHEGGVAAMALGAALAGTGPGVCLVHQGPGFTNALTPLVEAAKSRVPMLMLVGDTAEGDSGSPFHVDEAAITAALGVRFRALDDPRRAAADLAAVVEEVVRTSAPMVVSVPRSLQAASSVAPTYEPAPVGRGAAVDEAELAKAMTLLGSARRPLVLAGRGAWSARVGDDLGELARRLGAPTCTTALAKGLFAGEQDLGVCGGFALPEHRDLIARADVVLAVGTSLSRWTTLRSRLFGPGTRVVRIDSDPRIAVGRHDVQIRGDAARIVPALLDRVAPADQDTWAIAPSYRSPADPTPPGVVHPVLLSRELDRLLPPERTLVVDGGHFMGHPMTFLAVPDPAAVVLTSARYQAIGLGLGAAVGAALARPDRLTVLCAGDAGTAMAASELETAGRLAIPLVTVVYNDAQYGAEVHHFGPLGEDTRLDRYPSMQLADVARAWGWHAATVRSLGDLGALEVWLADRTGPLLLDARVDPHVVGHFFDAAHGR